jgi:hypothetical protein
MKRIHCALSVIAFVLLAAAAPVFAHHSFSSEFDGNQEIVVKGVMTRIEWTNPHINFYVDVKDDNGNITTWGFQSGPPNMLHRNGIRQSDYAIGETVTVTGAPCKDTSKHYAWFKMMKYSDGRVFVYRNGAE